MSDDRGEGNPTGTNTSTSGGPTVIDVTPTAAPEPEHAAEKPPKPRGNRAIIAALIALVLAVGTSPYWAPPIASILPWGTPETKPPPVDTAGIDAKLSALEARVAELAQAQQRAAALEPRVAQLEQRPASAPNPRDAQQAAQQAQALSGLADRIAALEQRITALAAAASSQSAADATKGLQAQVQALTQKLDEQSQLLARLQSQAPVGADRADAAALAFTLDQLRAALATARPYAAALQAAEAVAKDAPDTLAELKKLDARAPQGVPTVAVLAARFPAVAQAAPEPSAPAAATDEGWRARTWAKLKNLVTIRRVGEGEAGAAPRGGDLGDAETALKTGDLAAAVAALRRADGPASPAAAAWLEDAQARLDAEAALAAADATLMKRFLASPAGAQP
jgi:hypothetical protein